MKKILSLLLILSMIFSVTILASADNSNESEDVHSDSSEDTNQAPEVLELSLEDAINYAFEHGSEMKLQDLMIEKAQVAYDDNIRAVRNYEKTKDMPNPYAGMPRTYEAPTPDQTIARILLKNGVVEKSTELSLQVAKWNKELKENEIKYNVEKAYYDLAKTEKSVQIAKEGLDLAKNQHEQGKKMFELGTISSQQLLSFEMAVSQAQSGYDGALMGYELQKMSFNTTLGLPLDQDIKLTDEVEYKEYNETNLEEVIASAFGKNAGLKVAEENYEISELSLQATKSRFPENTFRYREQAVAVEMTAQSLITAKNGVEMGVRAAYLGLITSEKQIKTYELAVTQAQRAYELAELSFELGENTINDVTSARIQLMNAKNDLAGQIHAYNMALLDFKYSTGIGKAQIPTY